MGRYKYLEEKAKALGKTLFIENVALDVGLKNLEVFDSPRLIESSDKKQFRARAVIKNVPVSKFTENLNQRIYGRDLDERIMPVAEGSLSLADHPENEPSVLSVCGVWHNPRMDENFSYGDWYLVGDNGQLIAETLQAGGKMGVSRVGLGDLLPDGKTVNPDTYELERYGDAVITPSQEVFAAFEHISEINFNSLKETTNKIVESQTITTTPTIPIKETTNQHSNILNTVTNNKVTNLENVITNNKEEEKSEVNGMGDINKIQELAFKNKINRTIKEAKKKENILEAIEDLNEIELLESMTDEKVLIKNTISELQGKLEDSKKNLEEKFVKTEESFAEIKSKHEIQTKMLETLRDKFKKIDETIKSHGLSSLSDIEAMKESINDAVYDIGILREEKINLLSDLKTIMSERVDMLKDIKVYRKERQENKIKGKKLMTKIEALKKKLAWYERYSLEMETFLKEKCGYNFKEEEDVADKSDDEEEKETTNEKKESRKNKKFQYKILIVEEDEDKDSDDVEDDEEEEKSESFKNKKFRKNIKEEEEDEDADDMEEEEEDDDEEEKSESFKNKKFRKGDFSHLKEEEDEEEEEEEDEETEKETKSESAKKKVLEKEIKKFYEMQVNIYPGIKDFKEQIISSKSFVEAADKIETIKGKSSKKEQVKFSENSLKTSWIPKGRK